jgi:hypothetical protein
MNHYYSCHSSFLERNIIFLVNSNEIGYTQALEKLVVGSNLKRRPGFSKLLTAFISNQDLWFYILKSENT